MPSFFSRFASRAARESSSINVTPALEPSMAAIPSADPHRLQAPYNPSPEPSHEASSPIPFRTPSEPDIFRIADAPGPDSPSSFHSTSSLIPSDASSEADSFQSDDLLGSYHISAAQSSSSVASSDISSEPESSESSNRYTPSRADQSEKGASRTMLTSSIVDSEFISHVVGVSYPRDQGSFNNSWTWLEAAPTETPPDWRIYTNLHASRTWQTNEVVLDKSN
ncbi:hypothetical protein EDB83DRAFT_2337998 [Lactarius deliciosus]|nr:hypothetical protein EDB83DRAFT_2337998 [Lactarius deliciosus]